MHHALVLSIFSSTFLVLTTLWGTTADPDPKSFNDYAYYSLLLPSQNYGRKINWSNLREGSLGKRDWNQFRGVWGKRGKDYYEMPKAYYELENTEFDERNIDDDQFEEKRGWNNMKGSWGKRDWSSFRGVWGKRDLAWGDPVGVWGKHNNDLKRVPQSTWTKMKGNWGK